MKNVGKMLIARDPIIPFADSITAGRLSGDFSMTEDLDE